jgi:hypothetical protein
MLGVYGSKWSWETGKWTSADSFIRSQRKWTIRGIGLTLVFWIGILWIVS